MPRSVGVARYRSARRRVRDARRGVHRGEARSSYFPEAPLMPRRTKRRVRRHGFFRSHRDTDTRSRRSNARSEERKERREDWIPSSADYLCTSSRDSFHCNGAGSLGSERSQADGKMFLFSSLKLFIKGSVLPRVLRGYGPPRAPALSDSRKRDCGLLTTTPHPRSSPSAPSYISYLYFSRSRGGAGVLVGLPV